MSMNIEFLNIRSGYKNQEVLKNISGSIRKNEMTAIMGSSGGGKTTLIKILSGRNTNSVIGDIYLDNMIIKNKTDLRNSTAFVYQQDFLPENLTVKEYCTIAAQLKLMKYGGNKEEIEKKVHDSLRTLGLDGIQNSRILNSINGLSGGQRKRVNIAAEILGDPEIIFLDEPTSGLDVLSALETVRFVKSLNNTVISTIHQPNSQVFNLFDNIILLHEGKIFYNGKRTDLISYVQSLGFEYDNMCNIADYIFTDVFPNIRYTVHSGFIKIGSDIKRNEQKLGNEMIEKTVYAEYAYTTSHINITRKFFGEMHLLAKRNFKNMFRNKFIGLARILQSVFIAVIIGPIFYDIPGKGDLQIVNNNIRGFLYQSILNTFYNTAFTSTSAFYYESALIYKEYKNNYYYLISYYISKLLSDFVLFFIQPLVTPTLMLLMTRIPYTPKQFCLFIASSMMNGFCAVSITTMITGLVSSSSVALTILSIFLLPMAVLSGLVADPTSLPIPFSWFQYFSFTRYLFNINIKLTYDNTEDFKITDPVTKNLYESFFNIKTSFLILFLQAILYYILGFIFLNYRIKHT